MLIRKLEAIAAKRDRWDVVAAHAARSFFGNPSRFTFDALIKAATQAEVEPSVRAAALRFLATGVEPFRTLPPTPSPAPAKKAGKKKTAPGAITPSAPPAPQGPRLAIDADWPLPVPDYLTPPPSPYGAVAREPRPHREVLLTLAIAARDPVEALRWFDEFRAERRNSHDLPGQLPHADDVAALIAPTHPERAIEIYRAALDGQLPNPNQASYVSSARYLNRLRPLYDALDRPAEWTALVASIRAQYKNRSRFLEVLDRLEDTPDGLPPRPKRP